METRSMHSIKDRMIDYTKDFFEIAVISLLGLLGLVFIFISSVDPHEKRNNSLLQRLEDAFKDIKTYMSNVVQRKNI